MSNKWSDNDEKILLLLALEHGATNYAAIEKAWTLEAGKDAHSLRAIADRLRSIRAGARDMGVVKYFSAGGRVKKPSAARPQNPRRSIVRVKHEEAARRSIQEDLYDGTPFVHSRVDGHNSARIEVKAEVLEARTTVDPAGTDRKLRDRASRISFQELSRPQDSDDDRAAVREDSDGTDGDYQEVEGQKEDDDR